KEWETPSMRGLPEIECSHQGRSFSPTFHGINFRSGCRTRDVHVDGRVQRLQPNHDCAGRPAENLFHHRVWSIRIPSDAFWIDVCTSHLPKGYDEDLCRLSRQIYEGLSG